ncbi:MAG: dual specificity protein phosphatase family protein [Alphaproteobacteria bacterium]|nr:dual specificity protein phosphatase family protein [Alphaproteobacteria bacterium]
MTFGTLDLPGGGGGRILIASCPGVGGGSLAEDMAALKRAGAVLLLSLLPEDEVARRGLAPGALEAAARAAGLLWFSLPIADYDVPGAEWEQGWRTGVAAALHGAFDAGLGVALHCRAGLGRSGTIAARLLVERGTPPTEAVRLVRAARPGAIETAPQMAWLYALKRGAG